MFFYLIFISILLISPNQSKSIVSENKDELVVSTHQILLTKTTTSFNVKLIAVDKPINTLISTTSPEKVKKEAVLILSQTTPLNVIDNEKLKTEEFIETQMLSTSAVSIPSTSNQILNLTFENEETTTTTSSSTLTSSTLTSSTLTSSTTSLTTSSSSSSTTSSSTLTSSTTSSLEVSTTSSLPNNVEIKLETTSDDYIEEFIYVDENLNLNQTALNETIFETSNNELTNDFNSTITLIDGPFNKIRFDITNFTPIETNASESKSYSMRLHIQGFKWNEKFNDVNSNESINFLNSEILPILIKRLNLTVNDLHDVRLIKLFKASNQSNIKTELPLNEALHSNVQRKMFANELEVKILKGYKIGDDCSNRELTGLIKHALIKYNDKFENISISIENEELVNNTIKLMIVVSDDIYLVSSLDFYKSLELISLKVKNERMIKISNFLIDLENIIDIKSEGLGGDANLFTNIFSYQSTWIISLIIMCAIIILFFICCIVAICYTKKPYKKSNKIYDLENIKQQKNQQIPQIPSIQPSTKTTKLSKLKDNPHFQY